MIIFRLLEFVFKITATVFIVIFLQMSLGGRTLEEYLLSFLRDSERVQSAQQMTRTGFQKIKKDAVSIMRKQLNGEDPNFSIRNIATQQLQKNVQSAVKKTKGSVEESDTEESVMHTLTNYLQQMTGLLGSMGNVKKSVRTLNAVSKEKNQKKAESQKKPPAVKKNQ